MKNNYILRLITGIGLGLVITWLAYTAIIGADRRYFNSIQKNEFVFLHDTTYYDVLLLGSSRMKNNINPRIFDSITHLSSYNAGASGACIEEVKIILESYLLKHRPPQYVIMSLDAFSMQVAPPIAYYPTYITCESLPPIAKALKQEGVPVGLYKLLPFLKVAELNDYYKSITPKAYKGETDIAPGDYIYKGYVSNTTGTIGKDALGPKITVDIDKNGLKYLQSIIDICTSENITLVLTYAPEYKRLNVRNTSNGEHVMHLYDSAAAANNLPFYRSDTLALSNDPAYFVNNGHLNRIGADVYSTFFAQQLINDGVLK